MRSPSPCPSLWPSRRLEAKGSQRPPRAARRERWEKRKRNAFGAAPFPCFGVSLHSLDKPFLASLVGFVVRPAGLEKAEEKGGFHLPFFPPPLPAQGRGMVLQVIADRLP